MMRRCSLLPNSHLRPRGKTSQSVRAFPGETLTAFHRRRASNERLEDFPCAGNACCTQPSFRHLFHPPARPSEAPHIVQQDGRHALIVEGAPFSSSEPKLTTPAPGPKSCPRSGPRSKPCTPTPPKPPSTGSRWSPHRATSTSPPLTPSYKAHASISSTSSCSGSAPGRTATCTTRPSG